MRTLHSRDIDVAAIGRGRCNSCVATQRRFRISANIQTLAGLLVACAVLLFALGSNAQTQPEEQAWTLTTADFKNRRIQLVELSAQGARIAESDGQVVQLRLAQLVRLERVGAGSAPGSADTPFVLHLRSGDRLLGKPVRLTDSGLVMQTPAFGEVEAPLDDLLALAAVEAAEPGAWRQAAPAADQIVLANGDQMRGYVGAIDGDAWRFADEQGNETPLTAAAVRQVRFADPGVPANPATEGWRVRLADGSLLSAESLAFSTGEFTLAYRGREAKLPATSVSWLESVNGPVRWLADLPVAEAEHTPYFGASYPGISEAAGEAGARSFVVRSRSRLSFDIPEGYSNFRTRYALARGMTRGAVDLRILLDSKVAHERKALTAADVTEPLEIPLEGAKRITLEVDYGPGLDVQDVLHWIDPALVKG